MSQTVDVPDDVDTELLAKVLENPEMKALLTSLAKVPQTMPKVLDISWVFGFFYILGKWSIWDSS